VACHGTKEPPAPAPPAATSGQHAEPVADHAPEFPDWARSLELKRTVGVRLEAVDDAKRIGTIAIDTRVAWTRTATGKGCDKPWIEIVPHGWVCGDYVAPSKKLPYGQEVPHLDRGEIVPGTYGKVTASGAVTYVTEQADKAARRKKDRPRDTDVKDRGLRLVEDKPVVGSLNVRRWDELSIDGRVYWKISQKDNEFVLKSAVTRHVPSSFGGTRMSDDTELAMPIAFVWPRGGMTTAYTLAKPTGGVLRELAARTPIAVHETATDKAGKAFAVRIGDGEWMSTLDVRTFAPAPPPPLLLANERWIDIDLESQILVAFEGELPVYATLVSSGGKDTPTETGVYRMWLKESEADMKGLNGEDPYSVATVPWTQFFSPEKGLALHTAYWHDQFGHPRSHGCVNLAPRDARWLYFWTDPQVPAGWTMAAGVVEAPGSIVRLRSAADPNPEWKGYAKKVLEARQQNAPLHDHP
jgi:hypothetical protein